MLTPTPGRDYPRTWNEFLDWHAWAAGVQHALSGDFNQLHLRVISKALTGVFARLLDSQVAVPVPGKAHVLVHQQAVTGPGTLRPSGKG